MKKRKQILAMVLSTAMAAGMLAGCGGAEETAVEQKETKAAEQTDNSTDKEPENAEAVAEPVEVSVAIWGAEDGLANPDDPILKQLEEEN